MSKNKLITLLTDFGYRDHYVGAMKGAIYSVCPDARIVDISHDMPAFNVREAAYTLWGYASTFPFRTVHVAVVDPEVGSQRRPILLVTNNYYYLAPDNGILSWVAAHEEIEKIVHLQEEHFFRRPPVEEGEEPAPVEICPTFHGRDIFGPVAAWLCRGNDPTNFGEEIGEIARFEIPRPKPLGDKILKGVVLHVDRFGNLITNISKAAFDEMAAKFPGARPKIMVAAKEVTEYVRTYAEAQNLAFLFGSTGMLEIAAKQRSAAALLPGVGEGKEVGLTFA